MELTRRHFATGLLAALAAAATGLWRWTTTTPRQVLHAVTGGRFPGRLRPWDPTAPRGPAPWKG